jgi:triosephosphate isomerase
MFGKRTVLQLDDTRPYVFLNFKTYAESSGANALKLAKICEEVQKKTHLNFIVCVQAIDTNIASQVNIPVYAQHVDAESQGKSTGNIVPRNLLNNNIHGSLLNHSEKKLDAKTIAKTILVLKELDMKSVVCASNDAEAKKLSALKPVKPDFIAVEPPELIGTETSVSTAKPGIIKKTVTSCGGIKVLAGAGIRDNNDIRIALAEGAKGVLLSSHFVLAKDPKQFLMDLVKGF